MVYVIATIEVGAGNREEYLSVLHENVPNVEAEEGCIEYGPTVDLETNISSQDPIRNQVVTVVEKWESMDALHTHLASSHMATYREKVKDMVRGVRLKILQPA